MLRMALIGTRVEAGNGGGEMQTIRLDKSRFYGLKLFNLPRPYLHNMPRISALTVCMEGFTWDGQT